MGESTHGATILCGSIPRSKIKEPHSTGSFTRRVSSGELGAYDSMRTQATGLRNKIPGRSGARGVISHTSSFRDILRRLWSRASRLVLRFVDTNTNLCKMPTLCHYDSGVPDPGLEADRNIITEIQMALWNPF
nr:hypothetical protein CFP56_69165 [Quercus suber]